jgi:hypothetical protein
MTLPAHVLNSFLDEAVGVFALRLDPDLRIVWASPAFDRVAGHLSAVGRELHDYLIAPSGLRFDDLVNDQDTVRRLTFRLIGGGQGVSIAHRFRIDEDVLIIGEPLQPTQSDALDEVARLNNEMAAMAFELKQQKRELEAALQNVKTLKSMLPICAWCKKIRDDDGYWHMLEAYISKYGGAEFSHGVCPECLAKLEDT